MKEYRTETNENCPENNKLFSLWKEKYHKACVNTRKSSVRNGVLIEIAAQHPLIDGKYPNEEFSARLDTGLHLYKQQRAKKNRSVKIYVPGSVHKYKGISDTLSLSEAGCAYLKSKGIPEEDLLGNHENIKYKGSDGVYNSSDECYVASKIFEELKYGTLYSICSPAQLHRKALSYIEFGYIPKMLSVPTDEMFHNYVDEAFLFIPRLLEDGGGLQHFSAEAKRLRTLRKPSDC